MDRAEFHSSDPSHLKSSSHQAAEVHCLRSSSLLPNFVYPGVVMCRTRESVQTPTSHCTLVPRTNPGDPCTPHKGQSSTNGGR